MAQIDLKNAVIRFKDGSSQSGTINYAPPAAPTVGFTGSGGMIDDGVYLVKITYVTAAGETTASAQTSVTPNGGGDNTINVTSPVAKTGATKYKVYITEVGGSTFYLQNSTGTNVGTNYSLTTDPDNMTANPPGMNTAAYPIGSTDVVVAGLSGEVDNQTLFTIAGDSTVYKVTSHSPTSGTTTGLVFTPALVVKADHGDAVTFQSRTLEINIGEGNLTWTEKKNMEYKLNRGLLDTVREGDQAPVELKVDALWEFISASTGDDATPVEVVKNSGQASHWESSSDDACEPFAIDIEIEYTPPCGGEDSEFITFQDFRYEQIDFDLRAGTIAFSGKCNVVEADAERV